MFITTVEFVIPTGISANEANAETQPVIVEAKISKCPK